ncbi:hypothetical protein, partial [Escherichia coli]|uniref:hypothetical protein n=1 Tax=Escherichia coli TaxID=562 RepID=UPI003EC01FDD
VEKPGGGAHKAEFVSWRWEPMKNLPELIIPFKRPVYERVVKEFSALADDSFELSCAFGAKASSGTTTRDARVDSQKPYRPNVGIALFNADGR